MIKRLFIFSFLVFIILLLTPLPCIASSFDRGVREFNALKNNENRAQYRSHWLDIADIFQKYYQSNQKGTRAPDALFYLGRTYEELGKRSFLRADLEKAEDYYTRVASKYSSHPRGAEAQLRKSGIYLNHYNDRAQAYIEYLRVVYNFSNEEMRAKAQKELKKLDEANLEKIRQARGESFTPPVETPAPSLETRDISEEELDDSDFEQALLPVTPPSIASNLPAASGNGAHLVRIRHWSNDEYTRVVLDLDEQAEFYHKLLKPDPDLGTSHRLFIDLDQTRITEDTPREENVADGILRRIRSAQYTQDKSRVVLDIQDLDNFRVFALENPFRIVVDVYAPEKTAVAAQPVQRDTPAQVRIDPDAKDLTAQSLIEQLGLKVRTIMIDPGHGGKDPGAVHRGVLEKDVVLRMAKILGEQLKSQGFEVLYTRTTDVFVPLEERTAMANSQNVDLFISVHANAHRSNNIRGFEVYYLNFAQSQDAMRVAARENAVSTQKISDLQYILTDLMLSSKINESRDLANKIHEVTINHVRSRFSQVADNGVRQAPFYVLMGARMPAILLEIGYMTNEQDMRLIQSEDFLKHMAGGLTRGVIAYRDKIEQFARLE
ncbi:N-acetylmuramoyl-L-alanine amidase [Desulfonatronovibrio magnus]|uniref:N-acetylmuramoyl-L-alanine amidase n=1 Tax=Desulfonatronovibrio magnus TaxID=698827 RepID=UPI0006988910|nr:N-acetylmuramoyl-L-alanine amidase [Desulfonatronovibrio magnus]